MSVTMGFVDLIEGPKFIEGSYTVELVNKSLIPGIDSALQRITTIGKLEEVFSKPHYCRNYLKFGWNILQPLIFLARPCLSDSRLNLQNILLGSTYSFTQTFSYSSRWYLSYRISWRSTILSISYWANCRIFIFQSKVRQTNQSEAIRRTSAEVRPKPTGNHHPIPYLTSSDIGWFIFSSLRSYKPTRFSKRAIWSSSRSFLPEWWSATFSFVSSRILASESRRFSWFEMICSRWDRQTMQIVEKSEWS